MSNVFWELHSHQSITQFNDMPFWFMPPFCRYICTLSEKIFAKLCLETYSPTPHKKALKEKFFHRVCPLQEYWHVALLIKRYRHFKDICSFLCIKLFCGRKWFLVDAFGHYANGKVTRPHLTSVLSIPINIRENRRN